MLERPATKGLLQNQTFAQVLVATGPPVRFIPPDRFRLMRKES
jgi:hypothetical protein